MSVRGVVDRSWAETFGLDARTLRSPAVRVVADPPGLPGYRGVYLRRLGDGGTIGAPADVAETVRAGAEGLQADRVFTPEGARALVGDLASLVLGPSVHAYLDAATFVPQPPCDARRLGSDDTEDVVRMRDLVDPAQWSEGGMDLEPPFADVLWGAFEDGELVAVGKMSDFAGEPADVGLVTRPDVRGRGYGARLTSAMVAAALETIPVIRYRALETNTASRRVADKLGFVADGANIAVRLKT